MNINILLNHILPTLPSVKEYKGKLKKILYFLLEMIYEEPNDKIVITDKYKKMVHNIAENIDCRIICYLNSKTLKTKETPKRLADSEEIELTTGEIWKNSNNYPNRERSITIEPPGSFDSFKILEQFTDEIDDPKLLYKMIYKLKHKKPFPYFKNILKILHTVNNGFILNSKNWKSLSEMK